MIGIFRDEDTGEVLQLEFSPERPPKFGALVRRAGRRVRRLVTVPREVQVRNREFQSYSRPPFDPRAPRHDPSTGRAIFRNQGEIDNYLGKCRDDGETIVYD